MSFEVAPLSNFIRSSDRTPMTAKEYRATTSPQPDSKANPLDDSVEVSSQKQRVRDYMRNLTSQLQSDTSSTLIAGIGSRSFGASGGLYAGVGQMPISQIQSLIRKYA